MRLCRIGFGLGSFDLNPVIFQVDLDVKIVSELVDVRTLLPNQLLGEALGEITIRSVTSFRLIAYLLVNESLQEPLVLVNRCSRPSEVYG